VAKGVECSCVHGCRVLKAQEQHYRNVNKDKIVQCPHPDCNFWYDINKEDVVVSNVTEPPEADVTGDPSMLALLFWSCLSLACARSTLWQLRPSHPDLRSQHSSTVFQFLIRANTSLSVVL
jgi:hypothetical protein